MKLKPNPKWIEKCAQRFAERRQERELQADPEGDQAWARYTAFNDITRSSQPNWEKEDEDLFLLSFNHFFLLWQMGQNRPPPRK